MKNTIFAGLALAVMSVMTMPATAMPISPPGVSLDHGITLVEGGCGPRGYRAANGYCYPRRPPPPPPRYYDRRCPPGYHPSPYGCRPNY